MARWAAGSAGAGQSLAGRLRFGLIDLLRRTRTVALLGELDALQFAPPATLARRQRALLDAYVALVRSASSLYAGCAGFAQFPLIDKAFANAHREQLRNRAYRGPLVHKKTGGSTGQPFVYLTGVKAQSYLWASILLSWQVAGYRLGEPVAFMAGSALFGGGLRQRLYYALMNVRLLSAFDLGPARLEQYAAAIARAGCRLLYGYASAIHQLALHLAGRRGGGTGAAPMLRLRAVVCTAEVLTPAMRATIETAFGVPCYSQYGCNDGGVSAYECERRAGFHLITERAWCEVLDDGRLVSTDLANDAFFLPRYDTGDRVAMASAPCACGRGFPLIRSVLGRANDLVEDGQGNRVHSEFFTHLFRADGRISQFQVLYDERALVVIVHGADPPLAHRPYLERIGEALAFASVRFLANHPFVASGNGKHRFVLRVAAVDAALASSWQAAQSAAQSNAQSDER